MPLLLANFLGVSGVWLWSELTNRMSSMEMQMGRVQHESTLLGDLSGRVMHLEKVAVHCKGDVEHLMSMQDEPITSDHQQFERLKYLEKELDILREKVERAEMKWVKSCLCFLLVEVQLLWVQCSRVCLGLYLKLKGKSMSLNSREKSSK